MRKRILAAMLLCAASWGFADQPEFKPYGFIKGDMYYSTGGLISWGREAITAASRANGDSTAQVAFSAQHTRFGLKGGASLGEVAIGGVLEMDFFSAASNTNANANPRMRLAYAWIKPLPVFEARFGQQWDLFSPLNPTTNNTNANLWYNGNYGFRRPQFQVRYLPKLSPMVKPSVFLSVGEAAKEEEGAGLDNLSLVPMLQGRVGAILAEKVDLGVSGLYATFGKERDYAAAGISIDLTVPLGEKLSLVGEYAYGSNLNDVNVFTTAGSRTQKFKLPQVVDTTVVGSQTILSVRTPLGSDVRDRVTSGFWVNLVFKPLDFLHAVGGFAMESNLTEDLGTVAGITDIETNTTFYGDLIFPIGKYFSLAVEYQHFFTVVAGSDETYDAGVIDVAGKIAF